MMDWKNRFYQSKGWKCVRLAAIARDKGVCQLCGEVIVGSPEVHHTTELNEDNYSDVNISLNLDLLETLHHECHDRRHQRFGMKEKTVIVDDELNIDYSKR